MARGDNFNSRCGKLVIMKNCEFIEKAKNYIKNLIYEELKRNNIRVILVSFNCIGEDKVATFVTSSDAQLFYEFTFKENSSFPVRLRQYRIIKNEAIAL